MKIFIRGIFFVLLVAYIIIFRNWISSSELSAGDWVHYFPSMAKDTSLFSTWDDRYSGIGDNKIIKLSTETYFISTMKLFQVIDWRWYERIFWYFPFLVIAPLSSFFLIKKVVKNRFFSIIGSFIFATNTYILMLTGGGQVGVFFAYALFPYVILIFIHLLENPESFLSSIVFAMTISLLTAFDIRLTYVTFPALTILVFFFFLFLIPKKHIFKKICFVFIIPSLAVIAIHAFWLLPLLLGRDSAAQQYGQMYTSISAVRFFSFATFENALGLLHPNWPENIFGKIYFMKSEFLLLPILAFSSLFFIPLKGEKDKKKSILIASFVFVAIVGIFLSKGTHDPFGQIYIWMFSHFPGFILFRDSTKWYTLIAISYAVLISFSIENVYTRLQNSKKSNKNKILNIQNFYLTIVIIFLLFLIRPALQGKLQGTFAYHQIPAEYSTLQTFLENQHGFFRTLWVPVAQRFAYYSSQHPAITAEDIFATTNQKNILRTLQNPDEKRFLQELSIKYVIVPFDSEREIFLNNNVYDNSQYRKTIYALQKISWLKQKYIFGKIYIFAIENPMDHFWTIRKGGKISYSMKNPTQYFVAGNARAGDRVVFSETFDANWQAEDLTHNILYISQSYHGLNSFVLPKSGAYQLDVFYRPQQWLKIGLWISVGTIITLFFILIKLVYSGKK